MSITIFLRKGFLGVFMLFVTINIYGQCPSPGTAPGCMCETAEVLCSALELDGYQFSMSNYDHSGDTGPLVNGKICGVNNTVLFNPTWFAFTAWCPDLDLRVIIDDCTVANGFSGLQLAIYDGCIPGEAECVTNNLDCGFAQDKILNMTNLEVGRTYYFLVDGCNLSVCDFIRIEIINGCGPTQISDWTEDIMGPEVVCVGESFYYFGEHVTGANLWHWYLDGAELLVSKDPEVLLNFDTPGTFELCLDASNDPCVPEDTNPEQICLTIEVVEADAGDITADPMILCPSEISTVTVTDANVVNGIEQYIIIVGPDGLITEITDLLTTTVTYDDCGVFTAYSINFAEGSITLPSVGEPFNSSICNGDCCDIVMTTITFEDSELPVFTSTPADITIACISAIPDMISLDFTDNCSPDGSVDGVEVGGGDPCNVGAITRTWTATDGCGNEQEYTQTITIDINNNSFMFTDEPETVTLGCYDELTPMVDLAYNDVCLGSGSTEGVETGTADLCNGGVITRTWTVAAACDIVFEHIQMITIPPIVAPTFVTEPADVTMTCDDYAGFVAAPLAFANGGTGTCLIMGDAVPIVQENLTNCEGTVDVTWSNTDQCGYELTYTQVITVLPPAEANYVDLPEDITLSCENLILPGEGQDLNYTNNGADPCLIEGVVEPTEDYDVDICGGTIVYTWETMDACDRPISDSQTITIEPAPEATLLNVPEDLTLSCDEYNDLGAPEELAYTNGVTGTCEISGMIPPTIVDNASSCGGTIVYTWETMDACDRLISYSQTITIEPAPEATFLNVPEDITLSCDEYNDLGAPEELSYTNGGVGTCEISGMIPPTIVDNASSCGGTIVYTWTFTDPCGNEITEDQTITIEPAPPVVFIDVPEDITVSCEDFADLDDSPMLMYSNGITDGCELTGSVPPTVDNDVTSCGGTVVYTWTFTDPCDNETIETQTITVEPAPQGVFLNTPSPVINLTCGDAIPTPDPLTISNGLTGDCGIDLIINATETGEVTSCGGTLKYTWEYTDACDRTTIFTQDINVAAGPIATPTTMPGEITIECDQKNQNPSPITFDNGISGVCGSTVIVNGVRTGSVGLCEGEMTDIWTGTDACGNTLTYQRTVNVNATPQAEFVTLPEPITVECIELDNVMTTLDYSNSQNGICEISGTIDALVSGSVDACGGDLTYTWTFTDACNRTITHSQLITVNPGVEPFFVDPPDDIILGCEDEMVEPTQLEYDNGLTGDCNISGFALYTTTQVDNVFTHNWEFVSPCTGIVYPHTQVVTASIGPDIELSITELTLCHGDSYDLNDIEVTNVNGTDITITFHDDTPPDASNQISDMDTPNGNGEYVVRAVNQFGCEDYEVIDLFLETPPEGGEDYSLNLCAGVSEIYDLYDFLSSDADTYGEFFDLDGIGVDIFDQHEVDFSGLGNGVYNLYYIVEGFEACPNDTMIITIDVSDGLAYTVGIIECAADNSTYTVMINTAFDLSTTGGIITDLGGGDYSVNGIPITQSIAITISDPGGCSTDVDINPPNCDCPIIAVPVGDDMSICIDKQPDDITVVVPAGMTANWYNDNDPTVSILDGSLTLTFDGLAVGSHDFLVETYDPITECTSNTKTKITVVILALPVANELNVELCDLGDDSVEDVTLSDYKNMINGSPTSMVTFHTSMADAEGNIDPLSDNHQLTSTTTTLYTRVTSAAGCVSVGVSNFILNPLPQADVSTSSVTCLGDTDGSIMISTLGGSLLTSLDGVNYTTTQSYDGLGAGNYTVYIKDNNDCVHTYSVEIEAGVSLILTSFDDECNSNETNTIDTDDYYEFVFTIENNQGNVGTYEVTVGAASMGVFNYGSEETFTLPADGSSQTIVITDVFSGCSITQAVGPLTSCSTDCQISFNTITYVCNNNESGTDNSDDYYDVVINASAINGGSSGMYNVLVNNILTYSFPYDSDQSFTIPAGSADVVITIHDSQITECQNESILENLVTCSNDCNIDLQLISSDCNANDSPTNTSDDFYIVTINGAVLNGSPSSYTILVDNIEISQGNAYGSDITFNIPADGVAHIITIVDTDDSDCSASITTEELVSCSTDCILNHEITKVECKNSDTELDPTDDFYEITFTATTINGSTTYDLIIGGTTIGTYNYGETYLITLPADGSSPTMSFVDSNDPQCRSNEVLSPLVSCSMGCTVTYELLSSNCEDNDTALDPADDFWRIEFNVTSSNTTGSTTYELYVDGISIGIFNYGEANTQDIDADNMVHIIRIVDTDDSDCVIEYETELLTPCNLECDITAELGEATCDANGTNDDSDDDRYTIVLTVSNSTAGTYSFGEIAGQGDYNVPTTLGPFDISAGNFTLTIIDEAVNECTTTIEIVPPAPCSSCSQTVEAGDGGVISCIDSEVVLSGSSSEVGDYHWYNENGVLLGEELMVTVSGVGQFYFEVEYSDGCIATDSVTVIADEDLPTAIVVSDGNITCEKLTTILDGSSTGSTSDFNFFWYDADGALISQEPIIEVSVAGVYSLQVQDINNDCLSGLETVAVISDTDGPDAVIYAAPSTIFDCVIESIILTTDQENNVEYTWMVGGVPVNSDQIEVTETGTYGLTAIDTLSGCATITDITISSLIEYPIFDLSANANLDCIFEEITIMATTVNTSNELEGYWQDETGAIIEETDFSINVNESGTYYFTLTDNNNGCVNTDTIEVYNNSTEIDISVTPVIEYISGDAVFLAASTDVPTADIDTVYWTPNINMDCPDCLRTSVSPPTTDEYMITIIDVHGCVGTNTIRLLEIELPVVSVPNIFSPDGRTNVTVYGNDKVERILEFDIYDRWGNKVFSAEDFPPNDPAFGWDGKYKDQDVVQGVFVFRTVVLYDGGETELFVGDITVMK